MAQMEYYILCEIDFNIIIECKSVMYCEHEKHDIDFHKHKWQNTKFSPNLYWLKEFTVNSFLKHDYSFEIFLYFYWHIEHMVATIGYLNVSW